MKASGDCIEAIKRFEGLCLKAYKDAGGVLTIGYGHTGDVKSSQEITESYANQLLLNDVAVAESDVDSLELELTQGQYDALVDFVFNLGIGNLRSSTLLRYIRAKKETARILYEFRRWVYCTVNGRKKKLSGLVHRREWECSQWVL